MHSPLPDSSALEAGILEDDRPSRLSRVQDNVRNLLRRSVASTIRSSIIRPPPPRQASVEDEPRSPLQSPLGQDIRTNRQPALLPSPSSASSSAATATDSRVDPDRAETGVLFPPTTYQQQIQEMAHQSTMFNTRALAALHHPDLSDPSLALYLPQKTDDRQRRAWKRSRNRKLRQRRARRSTAAWIVVVFSGMLLVGFVATYLILATAHNMPSTFHILFILGILFATIVFAHAAVRLCFIRPVVPASPRLYVIADGRGKRRRRHHHNRQHHRHEPSIPASSSDEEDSFVPPAPIRINPAPADEEEVRPDSREAAPSASAHRASRLVWGKPVPSIANPPPAYGRWRGSVRADPELLHWAAVTSPTEVETPALPSPTYEEAMAAARVEGRSGPPSYVTRESPARRREMVNTAQTQPVETTVQPEMVEGRGIGIAE